MTILRLGYVHVRVTDLAEARRHYVETLGLKVTAEQPGKLYLKGWDEWDHHSVVLEEGGVGLNKLGFKVRSIDDLNVYENNARAFGATVERMSKGENLEVGEGIRMWTPSGHTVECYAEQTFVGQEVGSINPFPFPRQEVGVSVPALDHMLLMAEDVALNEKFFMETFDMYAVEQIRPELDSPARIATWLSAGQKNHDVAIVAGKDKGLHHFAFQLEDWSKVLRAADLMAWDDVSIDVPPTRHGITRGTTIYFFDPAGNRNETYAGGYRAYRDRPTVIWTPDQLGRGIFAHTRELNAAFTEVYT